MKVLAFLIVCSLWLIHVRISNAEQYRLRRIPLHPGRAPPPPPAPQIMKKWHMPAHMRQVPRPIRPPPPVHAHKKPVGPPRPQAIPLRAAASVKVPTTWPTKGLRAPQLQQPTQDKPFLGSPKIQAPEYDFHIQTNQIPNHSNLIKQLDEKGPIHTIPAPNLSPADKPPHIEEVRPVKHYPQLPPRPEPQQQHQQQHQQQQQTVVEIQKSHSYQVTESNDQYPKFFRQPQPQPEEQDFYKLLNQKQPSDSYSFSIIQQQQQPQMQHHIVQHQPQKLPTYKPTQQQTHFFKPEYDVVQPAIRNRDIQPQFHTFNYEEPAHKDLTSHVSAEYTLLPEEKQQARSESEAQSHSQFVQSFFDPANNVDAFGVPELKEELITGSFYATLPNKQAADALASLQEAGKLNSEAAHKMRIFVPDDSDGQYYKQVETTESNYDYEESQEDAELSNTQNEEFGNRIKPKNY